MNSAHDTDPGGNADTTSKDDNIPHARKGGTNPAHEAPKKMRGSDRHYIDTKLKKTFIKGHAVNVHRNHMDIVRNSAVANRRKVP